MHRMGSPRVSRALDAAERSMYPGKMQQTGSDHQEVDGDPSWQVAGLLDNRDRIAAERGRELDEVAKALGRVRELRCHADQIIARSHDRIARSRARIDRQLASCVATKRLPAG